MSFGNPPRITESFKRFVTSLPALSTLPWPFFKFDSPFVAFPFHRHATRNILQVLSRVSFLFFSFFSLSSFVSKAINPFGLLPRSSPLFLSFQESAVQIIALAVNCVAILKNHRFSAHVFPFSRVILVHHRLERAVPSVSRPINPSTTMLFNSCYI